MDRSYLFVPGNRPERIEKALASHADAVIIDLEDAVANDKKVEARESVRNAVKKLVSVQKKIFLRINDVESPFWLEDVQLANSYPFTGVVLSKANSYEDVRLIEKELAEEQFIIPLIESAKGVHSAYEIATASKRVRRLAFGALDYCLDLGISITSSQEELLFPRSTIVVASRAANIESPIDTIFSNFKDQEGLIEETNRCKQLGFFSKLCIHPNQTKVINEIFIPSAEEQKWAKEIVEAFEGAELQGIATIQMDGKMVDYPVYKKALKVIEQSIN